MKKLFVILLSALLLLSSCTGAKQTQTPAEIMAVIQGSGIEFADVYDYNGETFDDDILSGLYGDLFEHPTTADFTDYYVSVDETPLKPQEIGVFVCKDEQTAAKMAEFISSRIERLAENARNYQSVDATGINSAWVKASGCYVGYVMLCSDSENAINIVKEGIGA